MFDVYFLYLKKNMTVLRVLSLVWDHTPCCAWRDIKIRLHPSRTSSLV